MLYIYTNFLFVKIKAVFNVSNRTIQFPVWKQLIFTNKKARSLIASRLFICYAAAFRCHSANKRNEIMFIH